MCHIKSNKSPCTRFMSCRLPLFALPFKYIIDWKKIELKVNEKLEGKIATHLAFTSFFVIICLHSGHQNF